MQRVVDRGGGVAGEEVGRLTRPWSVDVGGGTRVPPRGGRAAGLSTWQGRHHDDHLHVALQHAVDQRLELGLGPIHVAVACAIGAPNILFEHPVAHGDADGIDTKHLVRVEKLVLHPPVLAPMFQKGVCRLLMCQDFGLSVG